MKKRIRRVVLGLLFLNIFASTVLANTGVVSEVIAGDLVRIGDSFVARLTGITAPPPGDRLGNEVFKFTKEQLEGKRVRLFTWTTDNTAAGIVHDSEGHPLIQIYFGENFSKSFNEVLLSKGYARVDQEFLPDDLKYYIEIEKEARTRFLGVWSSM